MTDTWLIVGLGNPGSEYSGNRHNVGQMVLDELASRIGGKFKVHKSRAQVVEGRLGIGGPRVVLAKPMTYKALATKDYLRVRVGVGRPPGRMDTADFVLRDFATPEKKDLPFLLDEAADAVELLITEGLLSAQQKHHAARS